MAETFKPSSPYDPQKFIDRDEEIKQIISLLRQSQPRVRAIVVDGDRGAGKTWLSLHLHRVIFKKEIKGLTSWLFSLWSPGEDYQPWGDTMQDNEWFARENKGLKIEEFLSMIIHGLSIELPPNPSLAEKVDSIRRYVQSHIDDRFVLILDSAYELETHFLGNLLTLNNFFVIVTGRGRPYPWKIPFLIEAIRFGLGKFSVEQIQEQLNNFGLSSMLSVKEIYEIGEGWPIFTEHLARAKNRAEALNIATNILFAVVPPNDRLQIRKYFEALSPLDGFGETEAALMVGMYDPNTLEKEGREICHKMNTTHLVSWKDGGYIINQPAKKVLREYLKFSRQEEWIRLNCAAYKRFTSQRDDPNQVRFRSFYEGKANLHAAALAEIGIHSPETCSK
jgi:hypothetical protein